MPFLVLTAIIWIALHLGISGTRLRDQVVGQVGERPFQIGFSVLSVVSLFLLVRSWQSAETTLLWTANDFVRWLLVLVMLPAFVLFVASVSAPNPTSLGPPAARTSPPKGMTRITRHPMLWSFSIWAAVHVIGNGDSASLIFFGAFLITALAGMPSIDAKLARRDPATWRALSAATSVVPFAAILQRRNQFVPREIGWRTPAIGAGAWIVVLIAHRWLFGVTPLP